MNVDLGIWSKLTKVVVGLVVLAFLLLIGMCYLPLIQQNERMRREKLRLETELEKERKNPNNSRPRLKRCGMIPKPSNV